MSFNSPDLIRNFGSFVIGFIEIDLCKKPLFCSMLELYECCTRLHCSKIRNSAEFAKNSVFFSRKIHQLLRFVFNIVIFSIILINFARLSKKTYIVLIIRVINYTDPL